MSFIIVRPNLDKTETLMAKERTEPGALNRLGQLRKMFPRAPYLIREVPDRRRKHNSSSLSCSESQRGMADAGPNRRTNNRGPYRSGEDVSPSGGTRSKQAQSETKASTDIRYRRLPFFMEDAYVLLH